jgi:F-type H+-transporting ATPase subunit epsilon
MAVPETAVCGETFRGGPLVARSAFPVEVLTPEGSVFAGEVEMLSTRTEVGEIGVLANHTPLLAMLAPADLRLHLSETEVRHFAQGEGYLQVHDNQALVLVEDCFEPDSIDRAEQEERLRKAEDILADAKTPADLVSARCAQALRDKRRAETFLRIAGGGGD